MHQIGLKFVFCFLCKKFLGNWPGPSNMFDQRRALSARFVNLFTINRDYTVYLAAQPNSIAVVVLGKLRRCMTPLWPRYTRIQDLLNEVYGRPTRAYSVYVMFFSRPKGELLNTPVRYCPRERATSVRVKAK